jgi:hypothetical protein
LRESLGQSSQRLHTGCLREEEERERGKERKDKGAKVTWISSSGDWNIWGGKRRGMNHKCHSIEFTSLLMVVHRDCKNGWRLVAP